MTLPDLPYTECCVADFTELPALPALLIRASPPQQFVEWYYEERIARLGCTMMLLKRCVCLPPSLPLLAEAIFVQTLFCDWSTFFSYSTFTFCCVA